MALASPFMVFLHFTHGNEADKWYPKLWEKRGLLNRVLAIVLWPIYKVLSVFTAKFTDWSEKLIKEK